MARRFVIILEATDGKHDRSDDVLSSLVNPRQVSAGKGFYKVRAVGSADARQATAVLRILNESKYVMIPS